VIDRLGEEPRQLAPVRYHAQPTIAVQHTPTTRGDKRLVGVDVFLDWSEDGRAPDVLGKQLEECCAGSGWGLKMVTNRGVKVFPDGLPETFLTDHWRCRFLPDGAEPSLPAILTLLGKLHDAGLEVIKTEHLYAFGDHRGYSLGQGE
jgi:isocitrate dehydrogenase